jgi:voltage-gated potassium channel
MNKFKTFLAKALDDHSSQEFIVSHAIITAATVISIISIILETVSSLSRLNSIFVTIEVICVVVFTIEYLSRIYVAEKKLKYIFSFWGILDLLTILPTFLGVVNLTFIKTTRILRILRLLRILRIAKISRTYLESNDETRSKNEVNRINIVIYFLGLSSAIVGFGSALYAIEHTQKAYANIPLAMIQAAKILLGGLGQAEAKTIEGEILILLIRLAGLALFGLLITVIGTSLNDLLFGKHPDK